LPFLVTPVLPDSYGIFTLEKLQDFYNIPLRLKISENMQKFLFLARE
jgi:hypothetical protein